MRKELALIILTGVLLCSCYTPKIKILGHGGMGYSNFYPMDSEKSIIKCLRSGAAGVEIDVQMTKDSVLVCFHDFELDSKTKAEGPVNAYTYKSISDLVVRNYLVFGYPIIALDSLLSGIKNVKDFYYTFDCKLKSANDQTDAYYNAYINCLIDTIKRFDLQNNVYIESQNEKFLVLIQKQNPELKLFIYPESFEKGFEIANKNGFWGITISLNKITLEQIDLAKKNNLKVAVWNVNTKKKNREAIMKNPDCIQTDRVKHILKLLD